MELEFADDELKRMYCDENAGDHDPDGLIKRFRKVVSWIAGAADERDLYALKSLHFKKLKGSRTHQRSLRINDQWRLIVEIVGEHPNKRIRVIGIEDYH